MLYCKHHFQLGPDDVLSFPSVNGASESILFSETVFLSTNKYMLINTHMFSKCKYLLTYPPSPLVRVCEDFP